MAGKWMLYLLYLKYLGAIVDFRILPNKVPKYTVTVDTSINF